MTRLGAFAGWGIVGAVAAFCAAWALVWFERDVLAGAFIVNYDLVWWIALGFGVVVGAAAASGATPRARTVRALVAAGVLGVAGLAASAALAIYGDVDFEPATFQKAARTGDLDTLEAQADAAVEERALIGLNSAEARRVLGPPDRVGRRHHIWVWDLGFINDFLGPGDAGNFYVAFDPSSRRVVSAKVDQVF